MVETFKEFGQRCCIVVLTFNKYVPRDLSADAEINMILQDHFGFAKNELVGDFWSKLILPGELPILKHRFKGFFSEERLRSLYMAIMPCKDHSLYAYDGNEWRATHRRQTS